MWQVGRFGDTRKAKGIERTKTQRRKQHALEKVSRPVELELKIYLEEKWKPGLKT